MTSNTPDDIAEKVLAAVVNEGYMEPHLILSGASRHGRPFLLLRPEGSNEVWTITVDGPADTNSPEGVALLAQAVGLTSD